MHHSPTAALSPVSVWILLVILLGAGLVFVSMPLPETAIVVLVFSAAVAKAILVVRHYMHLRAQPWLIYAIAGVPVLLGIAMVLSLIPDIAWR